MLGLEEEERPHLVREMVEDKGEWWRPTSHFHAVPEVVLAVTILWRLILVSTVTIILYVRPLQNTMV